MITYFLYLKNHKNRLIVSIVPEMKSLNKDWYKYINPLIEKYLPSDEIQKYAYSYKTPDLKSTKNNKLSQHSLKKNLQKKMNIDEWLKDISECNKLEFYSDIKSKFKVEPYLNLVENRSHKNALTRLNMSAHSLHINLMLTELFCLVVALEGWGVFSTPLHNFFCLYKVRLLKFCKELL